MDLDPTTRPTLEDILGGTYPEGGTAVRCADCDSMLFVLPDGDVPDAHEDGRCGGVVEVMDRAEFLTAIAEGDGIVAAVFAEWDARYSDGPEPSPVNEYTDDPLTKSMAVTSDPRIARPTPEDAPRRAYGPDGQELPQEEVAG